LSYECRLEPAINKFKIKNIEEAVIEAAALELEYVKVCGACYEFTICVYIHISLEPGSCWAELVGVSVTVSSSTEVDERVHLLFKHASLIVSNTSTGTSVFYVMKEHSLGVYYLLCRGISAEWRGYEPVDYEEIKELAGE